MSSAIQSFNTSRSAPRDLPHLAKKTAWDIKIHIKKKELEKTRKEIQESERLDTETDFEMDMDKRTMVEESDVEM